MVSKNRRFFRLNLLALVGTAAAGVLRSETALAACSITGVKTETCTTGAAPRLHSTPTVETLVLQGPNLTLNGGLDFENTSGIPAVVPPAAVLTVSATGSVNAYQIVLPAMDKRLIEVNNYNGVNQLNWGSQTYIDLIGDPSVPDQSIFDAQFALLSYSGNNTAFLNDSAYASSLTQFDGTLILNNLVLMGTGIQTEISDLSSGEARNVLGSHADITVSGGAGSQGVYSLGDTATSSASVVLDTNSFVKVTAARAQGVGARVNAGTGNASVDTAGYVNVTGANGLYAQFGVFAYSIGGAATVNVSSGNVTLSPGTATGPASSPDSVAVQAFSESATAAATVTLGAAASVDAEGQYVVGVRAINRGSGDASVIAAPGSSVNVKGDGANGLHAVGVQASALAGNATIQTADVILEGDHTVAVEGLSRDGQVSIDTRAALTQTGGLDNVGIHASAATGLTILSGGIFARSGPQDPANLFPADDSIGIHGELLGSGLMIVDTTAGTVSTRGDRTRGVILSLADGTANINIGNIDVRGDDSIGVELFAGAGTMNVDTRSGSIVTQGDSAYGLKLTSGAANSSFNLGTITTNGFESDGVYLDSETGAINAILSGPITVSGDESLGFAAYSAPATGPSGSIQLNVLSSVRSTGENNPGVVAQSLFNDVRVDVAATGSIFGGWEATPNAVGTFTTTGGVGMLLGSGPQNTVTLNNLGAIGAWSDRAVELAAGSGAITLTNGDTGFITGYANFGAGDDSFTNRGIWGLRDFADTTGAAVRDTKRVAVASFGAGNDVLKNEASGVLRVMTVAGQTTTDSTRQYLPDGLAVAGYTTATPGVEQAQLQGLERFENRGSITMSDVDTGGTAAVAGDVLLITSGNVNATTGVLTPGATPAVFLSDGGRLYLDAELNQGGAASHSDLLVTDSVALGPNGATRIYVANAGGLGAATVGSGIKLVDVLGGAGASAANAFAIGGMYNSLTHSWVNSGNVVGGAFIYNLFRSSALGDDGDWYLRTEPAAPPDEPPVVPPVEPPDNPPVTPPVTPVTYRPEAALFSSLPALMRGLDAAVPGSRQERLGDEAGGTDVARRGRAWMRLFAQDINTTQQGTVSPAVSGNASGLQLGVELYGDKDEDSAQIGAYAGQIRGDVKVSGYSNGVVGAPVGTIEPRSTFVGVYVSRSRGRGFYFDTVLQYGYYEGEAKSLSDGVVADIKGRGAYMSLEGGYGFSLGSSIVLEPQLQLAAQAQQFGDIEILNAGVTQAAVTTLNGRAGLRLRGEFGGGRGVFRPYVQGSMWQSLAHSDRTRFTGGAAATTLYTGTQAETGEASVGLSYLIGRRFMAFAEAKRVFTMGKEADMTVEGTQGSAGLRFAW